MGKKIRQKQDRQVTEKHAAAEVCCMIKSCSTPVRSILLLAIVIAAAVFGVYWKTLDNRFLTWDDRKYIYENPLVNGDGGVTAIWADLWAERPTTSYYPLTIATFWIEKHLVGIPSDGGELSNTAGPPAHPLFHVNQLILHVLNSVLIFLVLRALGAGFLVSAFTCLIFSLHPVNVESVAWMSERKNLLSGLFFWLSLLTYIQYRQMSVALSGKSGAKINMKYLLALFFFVLALFSKSATLVLAPVIITTDRLLDKRWSLSSVKRSIPFFAMGLVMIALTASRAEVLAKTSVHVDLFMRPLIAVSAIAHYFIKMILPINLAPIYTRWELSLAEPRYWLSLAGVIASGCLIWRFRGWLGDLWLWGLALFIFTISPIIGLKYFSWMLFSFVADHYMYLGSSGVILMTGLLLQRLLSGFGDRMPARVRTRVLCATGAAVIVCCGWKSALQGEVWQDNRTLWEHTLSLNPECFIANFNLGNYYFRKKDCETALKYYDVANRVEQKQIVAKTNAAKCLQELGRFEEAKKLLPNM